jgi:hypothetical protein
VQGAKPGGADICLTARDGITIDGTVLAAGVFAVSATVKTGTGGNIHLLTTDADNNGTIELFGNAITADGEAQGGVVIVQAQADVGVNGDVLANGNQGKKGGSILMQAVEGDIKGTVGGNLEATPTPVGSIQLLSCSAISGFTFSIPAGPATTDPPSGSGLFFKDDDGSECGLKRLIGVIPILNTTLPETLPPSPLLKSCIDVDCFCLKSFKVSGSVLTISGKGFGTAAKPRVKLVEFNMTCTTDPGIPDEVGIPFLTHADSKITLTLPPGASGHIILSDPVNGPSSSCSFDTLP